MFYIEPSPVFSPGTFRVVDFGVQYQISNAWGKAAELYKWLKNNNHVKKEYVLDSKKDVTNLVNKIKNNGQARHGIAAIFFYKGSLIHHSALSGQFEYTKTTRDIYFYAHTSSRYGFKIKYYRYDGSYYYSSLKRVIKNYSKISFCVLQ